MYRTADRHLDWDGCLNARDLGGLATQDGGTTRWGSIIRSDNPSYLTASGWSALHAYGVRTIIALRTIGTEDDDPDESLVPLDVTIHRIAIEDRGNQHFVEQCVASMLWCTPLYFATALECFPELHAHAFEAIARAEPGGVVLACGRGCDRTGIMSMLLLALAGVAPSEIAHDWLLSIDRLRTRDESFELQLQTILEQRATTVHDSFEATLSSFDVASYLRGGGLSAADLDAARQRLAP